MTTGEIQSRLDSGPQTITLPAEGVPLDRPLLVRRDGLTIQGSGGKVAPPPSSAAFVVVPAGVLLENPASHRIAGPEGRWAYRTRGKACLLFLGTPGDLGPRRTLPFDRTRNWESVSRFQLDLRVTRHATGWDTGYGYSLAGVRGPTVADNGYDLAAPWYLFHSPGEELSLRFRDAAGVQRAIFLPTPTDETLTICIRLDFAAGHWSANLNGTTASGELSGGGFSPESGGAALIVGNSNVNGGPESGPDLTFSGLVISRNHVPPAQWFAPTVDSVFHLSHPWGLETAGEHFCGWQGPNGYWGWGLMVRDADGIEFGGLKVRDVVIERGGSDVYGCGLQLWPGWELAVRDTAIVGGAYGVVTTAGLSSNSYPWRFDNVLVQNCAQSAFDLWNVASLRIDGLAVKHCGPYPLRFRRCNLFGRDWFVTEGSATEIGRASCRERVSSPV